MWVCLRQQRSDSLFFIISGAQIKTHCIHKKTKLNKPKTWKLKENFTVQLFLWMRLLVFLFQRQKWTREWSLLSILVFVDFNYLTMNHVLLPHFPSQSVRQIHIAVHRNNNEDYFSFEILTLRHLSDVNSFRFIRKSLGFCSYNIFVTNSGIFPPVE